MAAMEEALTSLFALGAVDAAGDLVRPLGERMAELPLEPRVAKFVLEASARLLRAGEGWRRRPWDHGERSRSRLLFSF